MEATKKPQVIVSKQMVKKLQCITYDIKYFTIDNERNSCIL
jgi:hypothetical protein